jgi:hypothetical protein
MYEVSRAAIKCCAQVEGDKEGETAARGRLFVTEHFLALNADKIQPVILQP